MHSFHEREELVRFLTTQHAQTLAQALLELAEDHAPVAAFLERMRLHGDATALTPAFTERLQHWATDQRYIRLDEASAFGHELDMWVAEVQREVLPRLPAAAMGLFAAFLELDSLFERVDDDGAYIGGSFELACWLWMAAAQAMGLSTALVRSSPKRSRPSRRLRHRSVGYLACADVPASNCHGLKPDALQSLGRESAVTTGVVIAACSASSLGQRVPAAARPAVRVLVTPANVN